MGVTRFSGPVYGAKSALWSIRIADVSSGAGDGLAAVVVGKTIVPSYEDWYVTEFVGHRASTGSTGLTVAFLANSTSLTTITFSSSLAGDNQIKTLTADGGEYEGVRVAAGSTISFTATQSSVTSVSSGVDIGIRGFIRYIDSTRAV